MLCRGSWYMCAWTWLFMNLFFLLCLETIQSSISNIWGKSQCKFSFFLLRPTIFSCLDALTYVFQSQETPRGACSNCAPRLGLCLSTPLNWCWKILKKLSTCQVVRAPRPIRTKGLLLGIRWTLRSCATSRFLFPFMICCADVVLLVLTRTLHCSSWLHLSIPGNTRYPRCAFWYDSLSFQSFHLELGKTLSIFLMFSIALVHCWLCCGLLPPGSFCICCLVLVWLEMRPSGECTCFLGLLSLCCIPRCASSAVLLGEG